MGKCEYYFRITFFPIIVCLQVISSVLNFLGLQWESGGGFAGAACMLTLFIVIVVRLGYKSVSQQIQDELTKYRLASPVAVDADTNRQINANYGANGNGSSVPLLSQEMQEVEAEHKVLTTHTVFRRSPMPFILFAFIVMLPALGATGYYLAVAIKNKARFNPFESGNDWIPFIAYISIVFPCIDVIKVLLSSRKEVREYMLNGSDLS